jgi:hypothetical protein
MTGGLIPDDSIFGSPFEKDRNLDLQSSSNLSADYVVKDEPSNNYQVI